MTNLIKELEGLHSSAKKEEFANSPAMEEFEVAVWNNFEAILEVLKAAERFNAARIDANKCPDLILSSRVTEKAAALMNEYQAALDELDESLNQLNK